MIIKENVCPSHRALMESIEGPFGEFLQGFSVIDGTRHKISRVMFREGGLAAFLKACRDPDNAHFIGVKAEATLCCSKLLTYMLGALANCNAQRLANDRKAIPYGGKLWIKESLGVYITLGQQDLEAFFRRGEELRKQRQAEELDDGDHRWDGGND